MRGVGYFIRLGSYHFGVVVWSAKAAESVHMKKKTLTLIFVLLLTGFVFLRSAHALVPPPDGGYPGFNTAEGQNALFSRTTGVANTAVGWDSLLSNTDGSFNTAIGAGTLLSNIGDQSTGDGTQNTAIGTAALLQNNTGSKNTAAGVAALSSNTTGVDNTAIGAQALLSNTTGVLNNAFGFGALRTHEIGDRNNAFGGFALLSNTSGGFNNAFGGQALQNSIGNDNTAIGSGAGLGLVTGDGNVYLGADVQGEDGVSDSTYIRNVNTTVQSGTGFDTVTVRLVDGKLGHAVSSRRYKEDIQPMDKRSEALFALKPVMFRYKKQVDPEQGQDYGLIAEEVAKVAPELAVRDREGKISNYRRDAINAMLLNEFLKEHNTVQEQGATITALRTNDAKQQATIARLEKQVETLTAGLQKVSAQLELNKPAPQTVKNND